MITSVKVIHWRDKTGTSGYQSRIEISRHIDNSASSIHLAVSGNVYNSAAVMKLYRPVSH
jgi:hypothetical protein